MNVWGFFSSTLILLSVTGTDQCVRADDIDGLLDEDGIEANEDRARAVEKNLAKNRKKKVATSAPIETRLEDSFEGEIRKPKPEQAIETPKPIEMTPVKDDFFDSVKDESNSPATTEELSGGPTGDLTDDPTSKFLNEQTDGADTLEEFDAELDGEAPPAPEGGSGTPPPIVLDGETDDGTPSKVEEKIPPIIARKFPVRSLKRSASNRVYLLEDSAKVRPPVGAILLLKKNKEAQMAFRIIKTYVSEGKDEFAGRRVRKYGTAELLPDNETYDGLLKIRDFIPNAKMTPLSTQDEADLLELEGAGDGAPIDNAVNADPLPVVSEFDVDLDSGTSPDPAMAGIETDEWLNDQHSDQLLSDITIETLPEFDRDRHALSVGAGLFQNIAPPDTGAIPSGAAYYAGPFLRYGLTVVKAFILNNKIVQDSLVLETMGSWYSAQEFVSQTSYFQILRGGAQAQYNLHFGPKLSIFGYVGANYSMVVAASGVDANEEIVGIENLTRFGFGFGGGLQLGFGPRWFLRTDIGIDFIGAGLVLRF